MRAATAEHHLPNDPGTFTMAYVADEIVSDWRRAFVLRKLGRAQKILDPATNPLILARIGHSRTSIARQAALLRRARKGEEVARKVLMERYACRVWQRADLPDGEAAAAPIAAQTRAWRETSLAPSPRQLRRR